MGYDYSSTQILLPENEAMIFTKFSKEIIKPSVIHKPDEYGFPDDKHVTVLYGIHAEYPSLALQDFIQHYPRFLVTLGKVSLFKSDEYDVVKLDVRSPDLHVLNSEFKEIEENTQSFPNYIPHATIAYVKCGTCDHLEGIDTLNGLSFVPEFIQFSSTNEQRYDIPLGRK